MRFIIRAKCASRNYQRVRLDGVNPIGVVVSFLTGAALFGIAAEGDQPITGHWEDGAGGIWGFPVNLVMRHLVFNAYIATAMHLDRERALNT